MKHLIKYLRDLFRVTLYNELLNPLDKYAYHPDAVVIACYYNPHKSPYRKQAFDKFYDKIKHLNHRIIELVIGDSEPDLDINSSNHITQHHTDSLLWHKETILNNIIETLPKKFKYVFWLDADVEFENLDWLVDSVYLLENGYNIVQPFSHCLHLEKDEKPRELPKGLLESEIPNNINKLVWRSFAYNHMTNKKLANDLDYNTHGHVGFAWGSHRHILDKTKLFDHALIGGADHIMAHCAEGRYYHPCLTKTYDPDTITLICEWGSKFFQEVKGKIGAPNGTLYHHWHGDVAKRDYYHRIKKFERDNASIKLRDSQGYFIPTKEQEGIIRDYYKTREVMPNQHLDGGVDFLKTAMLYSIFFDSDSKDKPEEHTGTYDQTIDNSNNFS